MTEMFLLAGKMDGAYRSFTESGHLDSRGEYRNGKEIRYEILDTALSKPGAP